MCGLALTVFSDSLSDRSKTEQDHPSHAWLGDLFVICHLATYQD